MLSEGEIMPEMLVPDIPTTISNFSPKNFNNTYDGAVTAREALIRSLNIPAVRMLKDFGVERFYQVLKNARLFFYQSRIRKLRFVVDPWRSRNYAVGCLRYLSRYGFQTA